MEIDVITLTGGPLDGEKRSFPARMQVRCFVTPNLDFDRMACCDEVRYTPTGEYLSDGSRVFAPSCQHAIAN